MVVVVRSRGRLRKTASCRRCGMLLLLRMRGASYAAGELAALRIAPAREFAAVGKAERVSRGACCRCRRRRGDGGLCRSEGSGGGGGVVQAAERAKARPVLTDEVCGIRARSRKRNKAAQHSLRPNVQESRVQMSPEQHLRRSYQSSGQKDKAIMKLRCP